MRDRRLHRYTRTLARESILLLCALGGCTAASPEQSVVEAPGTHSPGPPTPPPAAPTVVSAAPTVVQQSPTGGAAALSTGGITGVSYITAIPWGQLLLMVLMLWLSHRREMIRLRRCNGVHPNDASSPR